MYNYNDYLAHHGIEGQKWGQQNGPPYPLDANGHSAAEKRAGTSGWTKEARKDLKKDIKNTANYMLYAKGGGRIAGYDNDHRNNDYIIGSVQKRYQDTSIKSLYKDFKSDNAQYEKAMAERNARIGAVVGGQTAVGLMTSGALATVNPRLLPVFLGIDFINAVGSYVGGRAAYSLYGKETQRGQAAIESLMKKGYGDMTINELKDLAKK